MLKLNLQTFAELSLDTNVFYNNSTIATAKHGQTITLSSSGLKALTDIVIYFGTDGLVVYNNRVTLVSAGQTATFLCKGKKLSTDIIIDMLSGTYETAENEYGTTVIVGTYTTEPNDDGVMVVIY